MTAENLTVGQEVRTCAWCESEISGAGEAMPVMYARVPVASDNWQCSDPLGCQARQDELDRAAGLSRTTRRAVAVLIPSDPEAG